MKKALPKFIVIVAASALFSSCAKDGVQALTPLATYNMSAMQNGQLITFNTAATYHGDTALYIFGTWSSNINYTYLLNFVHIKPATGYIGTYDLAAGAIGSYAAYQTNANPPTYIFNYLTTAKSTGTISISAYNSLAHTISGTFSFSGYDYSSGSTTSITGGTFTNVPMTP